MCAHTRNWTIINALSVLYRMPLCAVGLALRVLAQTVPQTKILFAKGNVKELEEPAQSPDRNLTEHFMIPWNAACIPMHDLSNALICAE